MEDLPDPTAAELQRRYEIWKHMYGAATADDLRSRATEALAADPGADPAAVLAGIEPRYEFDDDPVSRWG